MTSNADVRKAHVLLDALASEVNVKTENVTLLRSLIPALPAQMTLEEITNDVYEAWISSSGDEWVCDGGGSVISLEDWLKELHTQLQGLKDAPTAVPALPAGMRLADHPNFGRVVVSPKSQNGDYMIFAAASVDKTGADWFFATDGQLTFLDADSDAEPTHPEFLETEADYRDAPEGTIVAEDKHRPAWKPNEHWFINNNPFDNREMAGGLRPAPRRVLRWGWGE